MITFTHNGAIHIIPEHRILNILIADDRKSVDIYVLEDNDDKVKRPQKHYELTGEDAQSFLLKYSDLF